jgi:hypothetical protein
MVFVVFSQSLHLATATSFQMLSTLWFVCHPTIRRCIISILKERRKISHGGKKWDPWQRPVTTLWFEPGIWSRSASRSAHEWKSVVLVPPGGYGAVDQSGFHLTFVGSSWTRSVAAGRKAVPAEPISSRAELMADQSAACVARITRVAYTQNPTKNKNAHWRTPPKKSGNTKQKETRHQKAKGEKIYIYLCTHNWVLIPIRIFWHIAQSKNCGVRETAVASERLWNNIHF